MILKTRNLNKKYGDTLILEDINLTIKKGDIYGLIGKNGAGKTTFMNMILSLASVTSGDFELFGEQPTKDHYARIGSLIEAPSLFLDLSAQENIDLFSSLFQSKSDNYLLELVGLGNVGQKKIKDFSLGMKQRLGIAIALIGDPDFLILDEPVNGLDPSGIIEIRDLILKLNQEKSVTFLISSHLLAELSKIATKIGMLNSGSLLEETVNISMMEGSEHMYQVFVDDTEQAYTSLLDYYKKEQLRLEEQSIVISAKNLDNELLTRVLENAQVNVSSIKRIDEDLEEYFIRKVGTSNGQLN